MACSVTRISVDLDNAMSELEHYTGNVWTHIISLHREDAERLGYNNAQAWRALLRAHRNDIAAAMHIPPQDFRWYAAFHDEGHHPHVHMMAWSVKPGQAHLDRDGIRQIKSTAHQSISSNRKCSIVYEQKSVSRDELVRETRKVMLELSRQMRETVCEHTQAEQMIWKLSQQLGEVKGKKSYGYLPRPIKRQVDEIVDQLEQIPVVNECYQKWWELQCQVNEFYSGKKQQRPPLSEQKEFRAIRNAVIREAENIRLGKITFEDEKMEERGEWVDNWEVSYECLRLRARIEDRKLPLDQRDEAAEDLERLAEYGDVHAQYFLGLLYRDGGLLLPDAEQAAHWLELAAKRNLPAAQYALGKLYLSDDPEVHDADDGIQWLETSSSKRKHRRRLSPGQGIPDGHVRAKGRSQSGGVSPPRSRPESSLGQLPAGEAVPHRQRCPQRRRSGLELLPDGGCVWSSLCSVCSGTARSMAPAAAPDDGEPSALPHEQHLPGQRACRARTAQAAHRPQADAGTPGAADRSGPPA